MIFFLFSFLVSVLAHGAWGGGHETGNGGGGTVCLVNGQRKVRLLDLWEATALRGLEISSSKKPAKQQLMLALDKYLALNPGAVRLREFALSLHDRVEIEQKGFLRNGVAIAPPLDTRAQYLPKGCKIEGIALYNDFTDTLEVDRSLYRLLPETDKAALFFHEAVYRHLREKFSAKDSTAARNITGCAFAQKICPELNPAMEAPAAGPLYRCTPSTGILSPSLKKLESLLAFPLPPNDKKSPTQWRFQWESSGEEFALLSRAFFDLPIDGKIPGELELSANGALLVAADTPLPPLLRVRSSYEKRADELNAAKPLPLERLASAQNPGRWSLLQLNGANLNCQPVAPWQPRARPTNELPGKLPPWLPRPESLVRYFPLDVDSKNGTAVPSLVGEGGRVVNPNQRGLSREVGQGLRFQGGSARVEFSANEQTKISVSLWVQVFDTSNFASRIFDFPLGMLIVQPDHFEFRAHWDIKQGFWSSPAGSLRRKQWQHLVLTYDRASPTNAPNLYIDGVAQTLTSDLPEGLPRPNQAYPSRLGNVYAGDRGLNGTMRNVAIWNDLLSAQEVRALYEEKK